ncbi:MAG TPA: hypothetical protein VLE54_06695 [Thermoanaerobaculia bacterium]|nr:hypothetical protein [Thermoanaerobaculia bacterium]
MGRKSTNPVLQKRHTSSHIRIARAERRERARAERRMKVEELRAKDEARFDPARTKRADFSLPFETDDELLFFTAVAFGVEFPAKSCCPEHTPPAKAFCDAYFARAPITIWKGSRGFSGKTFMLSTLAAVVAATLRCDVVLLGGSGQQSQRALEASTRIWNYPNAPRHVLAGDVGMTVIRLIYGNSITALTASQKSVRGGHSPRLRLDEVDEVDIKILDAALGQTMANERAAAQTVLSSTHQYPDGTMTAMLKRAAERNWPVYEWCYRETWESSGGWLPVSEVGRKQNEVTQAMWLAEYELQEPSPEGRAIDGEALKRMFDPALGVYDGKDGEYVEIEPPAKGGVYAHGADWARSKDFTVIVTLRRDCAPMRLVAFERMNRLPWPLMVAKLDQRIERFGGKTRHDGTGLGDVVDGYLEADRRNCEAVILVGRARLDLFTKYIAAIERSEILAPMITYCEREHRYATNDDIYGSGHVPDAFVAGALAYEAATCVPEKKGRAGFGWHPRIIGATG